jgi:hypothetical protein
MIAAGLLAASVSAQTPTGPAPTGLEALANSPTSVHVTWTKGLNITAYMVARYRSTNMTTPERQSAWMSATTTTWDDPGLTGGTTYVYRLAARYSNLTIGVADKSIALPVIADAPAPVITNLAQTAEAIWPSACFDLPSNATALSVQRQREGSSTIETITPTPIPIAALTARCGASTYWWIDSSLTVTATFYYSLIAQLSDGRKGASPWTKYVPTLPAPLEVAVFKQDSYTAVVTFRPPPIRAAGYKLFGTGLPAAGVDGTFDLRNMSGKVVLSNLAAGAYTWYLKAVFKPGLMSGGVPVTISMP